MAVFKRDIADINLETGNIQRTFLNHSIGLHDKKADHFGIRVFRNGEPVDLSGVSVQGVFMPPQGDPIAITSGNIISGNVAEVVLPDACYNYDGQFCLAIRLVDVTNSVTDTVRIVDGVVDNTHSGGTISPLPVEPTWAEIKAAYEQAIAAASTVNAMAGKMAVDITAGAESTSNNSFKDLGNRWMTFRRGYYSTPSAGSTSSFTDDVNYVYALVACAPGDVLHAHGYGDGTSKSAWAFLDSSLKILDKGGSGNYEGATDPAPTSTAFALVNVKLASLGSGYYGWTGPEAIKDQIATLKDAVSEDGNIIYSRDLKSALEQTDYDISPYTGRFVVIAVHNNAYIKDTDGKLASYANWVASDFIPCTPGTVIHIKSRNGKYNAFYTDKNESSFLQALNYGDTVVPQTAKYFRVSTQKSVYDQYGFDITTDQTGFDIALTRVEDSISTASKWQAFSNDMNNLAENKIYQIMYNEGVSNLPFSGYFGTVVTFTHNNSSESKTTVQLAFGRYGKSAWRMKWGSTWGEWNLISIEQNSIMSSLISLSSDSVWSDYNYDFDNLPINKIFQIVYTNEDEEDTEHNTKHSPVPAFRGNVITFDYDPSSASKTQVQLAFARSGKTYRRMMWGSTWASWYEFANMDDIPNVGTAYKGLGDFIACGDSNTVSLSYPTSESGIPVKSWATSLAEMIGSDCDIYAAGGRSTAGFINSDDYAPAIADTKQFAILYLGINDCSQSVEIETFTANYTTIVNALLTNHQFVFCLNIPAAVQPSSRRTQYNTAIASVCSSIQKAFLVDITGCSDRIAVYKNVGHLSSIGYAVLAGEIAQAINKTMSENDYFDAQIDVDSN